MVVASFYPRLSRQVAQAASTLMALSCVGVKPKTSEPHSTPAFEPARVRLRVCAPAFRSCLARFVLLAALPKRLLPTRAAQLRICPDVARRVVLVDSQLLQLSEKVLLELARAVDEDIALALGERWIAHLKALHQKPGCLGREHLNHLGGPSHVPRNVVDCIPEPVCWKPRCHRFRKSDQHQFGCRGGATAAGRMVPKAQKGKVAHLSASRNRQPSKEAHQQASNLSGKSVWMPSSQR